MSRLLSRVNQRRRNASPARGPVLWSQPSRRKSRVIIPTSWTHHHHRSVSLVPNHRDKSNYQNYFRLTNGFPGRPESACPLGSLSSTCYGREPPGISGTMFCTGRMSFLLPNRHYQNTKCNTVVWHHSFFIHNHPSTIIRKDLKIMLNICKTFVRPHVEHCVSAWSPYY